MQTSVMDYLERKLHSLLPSELQRSEFGWLVSPAPHLALLSARRAGMIIVRVRLFAFLFALLTPLWSIVDYLVFAFPLWFGLAAMRVTATVGFAALAFCYRCSPDLKDAYRALALLFAIPTLFYITSHVYLTSFQLQGISGAIAAGYAFLPFVLVAGLSVFPLTLRENALFAGPILVAQMLSGLLNWETTDWPAFIGAFWLLSLIAAVATLSGASQLAFMIALVRQALRDSLTGAFSRLSGEEVLEMQAGNALREDSPMSLAFLDLDHFKQVNDGHGHDAGDAVLRSATRAISDTMRKGDMLVRWGGEEFLLILPNATKTQAIAAMERLRRHGLGTRPDGRPVTASIGIAERVEDGLADWHRLVEVADQRMYLAKASGRDRIVAHDGGAV